MSTFSASEISIDSMSEKEVEPTDIQSNDAYARPLGRRPKCFKSSLHEFLFLLNVSMAQLLSQAGITMSLSTMNIVTSSFESMNVKVEQSEKVWFMGSFALTVGTFVLISGRLGDIFGLKFVFMAGWCWVAVWSLVAGFTYYSKSIIFYITCRALQGIGFSLLLPCAMGLVGSIYPNGNRKNLAFSLIGAAAPTGATLGALMAAVLAQLAWWPWAFWILGVVASVLFCLSWIVIPFKEFDMMPIKDKLKKFDFFGSTVGVAALILFNFVWNQGPSSGWSTTYIIILLVLSVALIIFFFIIELKFAKNPLLPRSIFSVKIALVLLIISLGWGSFGIWQFYYWNIILNLRHYTPIEGGLTYFPFLILGIIAALFVSVAISRTKPSYLLAFCSVCFTGGCIMLSVMPVHQTYFRVSFGIMLMLCWAMDMSFPSAAIILSDYLPPCNQGMAGSLVSTAINYSVSIFLAIGSTVESQVFKHTNSTLVSYRAATYSGIGIAGVGVLSAILFIFIQRNDDIGTFRGIEENSDALLAEADHQV